MLKLYATTRNALKVRAGGLRRNWMDANAAAYHCLPLTIANCYSWELLSPCSFSATWEGQGTDGVKITSQETTEMAPISHFGTGILTFNVGYVPRTLPGYNLYVTGPINNFKDGIAPISAVIEADKVVATFTMNWRFTSVQTIQFQKGEPIASMFVIPRGLNETIEPEIIPITSDANLNAEYHDWARERRFFNETQIDNGTRQLDYHRAADQTKVRFKEPKDYRDESPT